MVLMFPSPCVGLLSSSFHLMEKNKMPTVVAAWKVRAILYKRYQFHPCLHAKAYIWGNPKLQTGGTIIWKNWLSKRIIWLSQLVKDEGFVSFLPLKQLYDLPCSAEWQYLKLKYLLTYQFGPDALGLPEGPELLGTLEILHNCPRLMSITYVLLMKRNSIDLELIVKVWEGEFSQPLKEPQWQNLLWNIENASLDLKLCLIL